MTPEQKVKWAILVHAQSFEEAITIPDTPTGDQIDDLYAAVTDATDAIQDARNEFREGEVETSIPAEYSRNYESKSVAATMPDGTWVGWTYWYGGGKHGNPEEIDWMEDAYDLVCQEEEKLVVVRTFTKAG